MNREQVDTNEHQLATDSKPRKPTAHKIESLNRRKRRARRKNDFGFNRLDSGAVTLISGEKIFWLDHLYPPLSGFIHLD
jgi:hypothetical protein